MGIDQSIYTPSALQIVLLCVRASRGLFRVPFLPQPPPRQRRIPPSCYTSSHARNLFLYLIVPFWYASRRHIRRVWSSHGSYFGETQSSQNTHGETKRAWYAAKAYQKGTIRYLPYPNSLVGNSDSIVSVWLFKYLSTQLASVFQFSFGGKDFCTFFRPQNTS